MSDEQLFANLESNGHQLQRLPNGEVDDMAFENGFHNGPTCINCFESWCVHCSNVITKCKGKTMDKTIQKRIDSAFRQAKREANELPKLGVNSKNENWVLGFKASFDYGLAQLTDTTQNEDLAEQLDLLIVEAYERREAYPDSSAMYSFMEGKAKGFEYAKKMFNEIIAGQLLN